MLMQRVTESPRTIFSLRRSSFLDEPHAEAALAAGPAAGRAARWGLRGRAPPMAAPRGPPRPSRMASHEGRSEVQTSGARLPSSPCTCITHWPWVGGSSDEALGELPRGQTRGSSARPGLSVSLRLDPWSPWTRAQAGRKRSGFSSCSGGLRGRGAGRGPGTPRGPQPGPPWWESNSLCPDLRSQVSGDKMHEEDKRWRGRECWGRGQGMWGGLFCPWRLPSSREGCDQQQRGPSARWAEGQRRQGPCLAACRHPGPPSSGPGLWDREDAQERGRGRDSLEVTLGGIGPPFPVAGRTVSRRGGFCGRPLSPRSCW